MDLTPQSWGFTPGEKRAVLFLCAALFLGLLYRFYQRSTLPETTPLTQQDSLACAVIAQAAGVELASEGSDSGKSSTLSATAATTGTKERRERFNVNTATQDQLESLPHLGPILASKIINCRDQRGGFHSLDELLIVSGVGPKRLETIRPYLYCALPESSTVK